MINLTSPCDLTIEKLTETFQILFQQYKGKIPPGLIVPITDDIITEPSPHPGSMAFYHFRNSIIELLQIENVQRYFEIASINEDTEGDAMLLAEHRRDGSKTVLRWFYEIVDDKLIWKKKSQLDQKDIKEFQSPFNFFEKIQPKKSRIGGDSVEIC